MVLQNLRRFDIVALQEVTDGVELDALRHAVAGIGYRCVASEKVGSSAKKDDRYLFIFHSRYTITGHGIIGDALDSAVFSYAPGWVRLCDLRTGFSVRVVSVHFTPSESDDMSHAQRTAQVDALMWWCRRFDEPTIVCGDFNAHKSEEEKFLALSSTVAAQQPNTVSPLAKKEELKAYRDLAGDRFHFCPSCLLTNTLRSEPYDDVWIGKSVFENASGIGFWATRHPLSDVKVNGKINRGKGGQGDHGYVDFEWRMASLFISPFAVNWRSCKRTHPLTAASTRAKSINARPRRRCATLWCPGVCHRFIQTMSRWPSGTTLTCCRTCCSWPRVNYACSHFSTCGSATTCNCNTLTLPVAGRGRFSTLLERFYIFFRASRLAPGSRSTFFIVEEALKRTVRL